MREIDVKLIENAVESLFLEANLHLPHSLEDKIRKAQDEETQHLAKSIFCRMCENLDAAAQLNIPICQDTGMAVLFCEIGQDVHFVGGDFNEAVNSGVRKAYLDGKMRCSIVQDPLRRVNTNDNTPALIHINIVPGDKVKLTAAPKGFGSENMSGIKMLLPSSGKKGVVDAVLDIVKKEGIEWLNIFAVDNVLQRIADPCFVGATIQKNCVVGAKVVRKNAPDEKVVYLG